MNNYDNLKVFFAFNIWMEIFGEKGFRVIVCFWPEIDTATMEFISDIPSFENSGKTET